MPAFVWTRSSHGLSNPPIVQMNRGMAREETNDE